MTSIDPVARLQRALSDRYVIDREIGRGGMATVYLARDIKHNRPVALKLLNPELGAVLGVERFLGEIQVTANLQHPNLLPLFDSGESDGMLFYVMPYVKGESLRARLDREKQLPIPDALAIATAVGNAVDHAHRHGVIHRDLKPENIMMVDGQPLVADFGIALAVSNAGGQRVTQTGLSLGTPQYMSPEQATGDRNVDGRSDVYSLGAITYEMLAGEPPHTGNTAQAIIAKVITEHPRSIRAARDTVPAHVEDAVLCALAKLPADRFATARAFVEALGNAQATLPRTTSTGTRAGPQSNRSIRSSIARFVPWAVAAFATAAFGVQWSQRNVADESAQTIRYDIQLPAGSKIASGGGNPIAVSRLGRHVAYGVYTPSGVRTLHIKAAGELRGREVPGSVQSGYPVFSPDGEWVLFRSGRELRKASVHGGAATRVADASGEGRLAWTSSGWIITSVESRLARMPAAGGAFEFITDVDSSNGPIVQHSPVALPDGKHVLYTSSVFGSSAQSHIAIASIGDGTTTILPMQGSYAIGVLDGQLVYVTSTGQVVAVPFNIESREVAGLPIPVLDQVADASGEPSIDMSSDGAITYVSGALRRQLAIIAADGQETPLIAEPIQASWPRLSPDAKRIALTIADGGRSDIWIYDLPAGPLSRLTTDGIVNDRPEWMPDGRSVVFRSNRGERNAIWVQPVDGVGPAQILHADDRVKIEEGVPSSDGRYLIFQRDSSGVGDLWYRQLFGDTAMRPVQLTPQSELGGRFSPDGKWVVYGSNVSGPSEVYVRPFPSLTPRYQVSVGGGGIPLFSRDGRKIFYAVGRDLKMVTIETTPQFVVTSRRTVVSGSFSFQPIHSDFDVMPDGTSIIALRPIEHDPELVLVHHWRSELRARTQPK